MNGHWKSPARVRMVNRIDSFRLWNKCHTPLISFLPRYKIAHTTESYLPKCEWHTALTATRPTMNDIPAQEWIVLAQVWILQRTTCQGMNDTHYWQPTAQVWIGKQHWQLHYGGKKMVHNEQVTCPSMNGKYKWLTCLGMKQTTLKANCSTCYKCHSPLPDQVWIVHTYWQLAGQVLMAHTHWQLPTHFRKNATHPTDSFLPRYKWHTALTATCLGLNGTHHRQLHAQQWKAP